MSAHPFPGAVLYNDRVVPWVSRFTGEIDAHPLRMAKNLETGELTLLYEDAPEGAHRDEHGVLWSRDGQDRSGRPEFGQVNALRQRLCMRERVCQVCGRRIEDSPIRWLLGLEHLYTVDGRWVTMSPPTCAPCAELACELCPHLGTKGSRLLLVDAYEIWGVYGEAAWFEGGDVVRRDPHAGISYRNPRYPLAGVLAKQQIVSFTAFREATRG